MGTIEICSPYVAMVVVQLLYGGSVILIMLALDNGMNQFVFLVYRNVLAIFILGPLAYAFERKQQPSLSFLTLIKIFVLSLFGSTIRLNVYYVALKYTSPTVGSALSNITPGLTFLLAVVFRMEKVVIRDAKGRAKIFGTLICLAGALIFIFWKGGYLLGSFVKSPLINIQRTNRFTKNQGVGDWIKGSALMLTSHVLWCAWIIFQASVCKIYPAPISLNTLMCFFAALQSSILALIFDRKLSSWKLEWNLALVTIICSGIVNSAVISYLQTWCISKKGPVFTATFSPLLLVIVAVFSAFAFAERLHLGSLLGALIIIIGLYCVLWGKSKDCYVKEKPTDSKVSSDDLVLDISVTTEHATAPVTRPQHAGDD